MGGGRTNVVVLGAGRVGGAIAADLAALPEFSVTVADRYPAAVEDAARRARERGAAHPVATALLDLAAPYGIERALVGADLVVGALPGALGFAALRRVLEAGLPIVDISFFPEDPFALDALARNRGTPAVVDAGVAPGLSNLFLGHVHARAEATESFSCWVGGLPVERHWPFEYRAPFSPADVIEEYVRPVRLRRAGRDLVLPALSEIERLDFPGVGTVEAFNTDGLRTLLATVDAPDLSEKTLRYPGHADLMRVFRETGFFATEAIDAGDRLVRPLDVTATLLFDAWRYREGEEDLTVMRVDVVAHRDGERTRHRLELLDRHDAATATSSMARTTGYTCTALARMVAAGRWREAGIAPPEVIAREEGALDFVLTHLAERGVDVRISAEPLPPG